MAAVKAQATAKMGAAHSTLALTMQKCEMLLPMSFHEPSFLTKKRKFKPTASQLVREKGQAVV